jgi:hypothetical protein
MPNFTKFYGGGTTKGSPCTIPICETRSRPRVSTMATDKAQKRRQQKESRKAVRKAVKKGVRGGGREGRIAGYGQRSQEACRQSCGGGCAECENGLRSLVRFRGLNFKPPPIFQLRAISIGHGNRFASGADLSCSRRNDNRVVETGRMISSEQDLVAYNRLSKVMVSTRRRHSREKCQNPIRRARAFADDQRVRFRPVSEASSGLTPRISHKARSISPSAATAVTTFPT